MKIVFFILLLIFTGCNQTYNISGMYYEYETNRTNRDHLTRINLKEDSTFEYSNMSIINPINSKGEWRRNGRFLILDGCFKPPEERIVIKEKDLIEKEGIEFSVKTFERINEIDTLKKELSNCVIIINGDTTNKYETNISGKVFIKKTKVRNVSLSHLSTGIYSFKTLNPESNYFEISLYPKYQNSNKRFFFNEKWIIKKNKIKSKDFFEYQIKKSEKKNIKRIKRRKIYFKHPQFSAVKNK